MQRTDFVDRFQDTDITVVRREFDEHELETTLGEIRIDYRRMLVETGMPESDLRWDLRFKPLLEGFLLSYGQNEIVFAYNAISRTKCLNKIGRASFRTGKQTLDFLNFSMNSYSEVPGKEPDMYPPATEVLFHARFYSRRPPKKMIVRCDVVISDKDSGLDWKEGYEFCIAESILA